MGRSPSSKLPILELGQQDNNSYGSHSALPPALRPTQLQVLEQCPKRYEATYVKGHRGRERRSARVGTLAHEVVEHYLRRNWELGTPRQAELQQRLLVSGVSENECGLLWEYCARLQPLLAHPLKVELEFTKQVIADALPLRGHIDLVACTEPGQLLIVDHKTNRKLRGQNWWEGQLQPLAYAWAVRHLWQGVQQVRFRIGYVFQDRDVEWLTDPTDDAWFEERFHQLWEYLDHGDRHRRGWQAKLNDACGFCPVGDTCSTLRHRDEQFLRSLNLPDFNRL